MSTKPPTIRKAQFSDSEWLVEHVRDWLSEPDNLVAFGPDEIAGVADHQCKLLKDSIGRDDMLYLVAEIDGHPVGEIVLQRGTLQASKHIMWLAIAVNRKWRNAGIGSKLLEEALIWAKANPQIRRIELWVHAGNVAAVSLYEKFGFVIEGRKRQAIFQNGTFHDQLIMALLLTKE